MGNFDNELHNYSNVPRELVFDSSLSDRARFVYVFMACKPEGWEFYLEPMSKELGYSKDTARKYITELVDAGWIIKNGQQNSEGKFGSVKYTLASSKITETEKYRHGESAAQDKQYILDNQEIEDKKKKEKALKKKEIVDLFEKCWIAYNRKGSKKTSLERWIVLTDKEREKAVVHIPFYVKSNDRKYLKDFERYISNKVFDCVVVDHKSGAILYDPEKQNGSVKYIPEQSYELSWNDYYGCYMFTGMFFESLADGYTDENRPDGATIKLNNARGTMVWSASDKKWNKEG